MKEIKSW